MKPKLGSIQENGYEGETKYEQLQKGKPYLEMLSSSDWQPCREHIVKVWEIAVEK